MGVNCFSEQILGELKENNTDEHLLRDLELKVNKSLTSYYLVELNFKKGETINPGVNRRRNQQIRGRKGKTNRIATAIAEQMKN